MRARKSSHSSSKQRAAALIAVLCLLSLLTMLALGALNAARRHAQLAQVSFAAIQQRELVDSALRLSILELSAPTAQASGGTSRRSFELFGRAVVVDVQREVGRIDLNFADELLLFAAFAGNGIEEKEAGRLAARIVDWRDADDQVREGGAERSEYRLANRLGPRNGPFETVSELLLVLGTESMPESLLQAFTVYSHSADVVPAAVVPDVMSSLRWAQDRQLGGRTWLREDPNRSEAPGNLIGEALRLRACSTLDRTEVCRTTVLRLTGDPANPALIFSWL